MGGPGRASVCDMRTGQQRSTTPVRARHGEVKGGPPPKYSTSVSCSGQAQGVLGPWGQHHRGGGPTHHTHRAITQQRHGIGRTGVQGGQGRTGVQQTLILDTQHTSRGTRSGHGRARNTSAASQTSHLRARCWMWTDLASVGGRSVQLLLEDAAAVQVLSSSPRHFFSPYTPSSPTCTRRRVAES
jgi:hypothetical protein